MNKFLVHAALSLSLVVGLAGCGGSGGGSTDTTTTTTVTAAAVSIGTDKAQIKTDDSEYATITATAIDASNAALPGVTVTFSATSGVLGSPATVTTDSTGKATVTLTSGTIDASNRIVTVTASADNRTASIPIQLAGSTLTITPSATSVQVGTGTITFTASAKNAGGTGVHGQTVRFSIGAGSTGAATLSASTAVTGVTGVAPGSGSVTMTPTAAGTALLTAEWLDSAGAASVTTTQSITITAAAGTPFAITAPTANPTAIATNATLAVTASVPTTINGTTVASVRFSATAGTWTGAAPAAGPATTIMQTPAANAVAATFTAPPSSGTVIVQVDALDAAGVVLSTLGRTLAISAPVAAAAAIDLQTSVATIVPSTGTNTSTATLTATVRDVTTNGVGNAPVLFELLGTTGSGESVTPAVAYTASSGTTGQATALFSAGSLSTLGPIYVRASLVGQACTGTNAVSPAYSNETNPLCSTAPLTVAAAAVSVTIGLGTTISDAANATQYSYPMSILVINANGSPVQGAVVSLGVFPMGFQRGSVGAAIGCPATYTTGVLTNEDVDRDGVLDAGEDVSGNGAISPPQADGGAVPSSVTTDANGVATFALQYPKESAQFITDELVARVVVAGTEATSMRTFLLPTSVADASAPSCSLVGPRPYP